MIPTMNMLTRSQRFGYVLSLLLLSAGWLFLLAFILEWRAAHWSRPALALQAAALVVALLLRPRILTRRLVVYPLILAGNIYLWDTTLPPPSFPAGWPRVVIPSLVLFGLLIDYARAVLHVRQASQPAILNHRRPVTLDEAARLLGISIADLRIRIQKRRYVIRTDAAGQEYVFPDDLHALNVPDTPAWWHLYLWLLLMFGLSVLAMVASIPAAWQMAAQIMWCLLTWGGMVMWVWVNWVALRDEDRAKHQSRARRSVDAARTQPLTPVQQHFLDVMERHDRR